MKPRDHQSGRITDVVQDGSSAKQAGILGDHGSKQGGAGRDPLRVGPPPRQRAVQLVMG